MEGINWFLPIVVFLARIVDVTLGTLRILYINKGKRLLAPILGFIEVFIWIIVVSQLVQEVTNMVGYLAYAAGFAAGNNIGMLIENRLAIGNLMVRAIVAEEPEALIRSLQQAGFGVTHFDARGANGTVKVVYTVIKRRELAEVIPLIHASHPHVFYTVEEIRQVSEGIFHPPSRRNPSEWLGLRGKG